MRPCGSSRQSLWKAATATVEAKDLKAGERRDIKVELNWSPNWKPSESASVELDAGPVKPLVQPLIPNQYRLNAAGKIKLDANLSDWPAKTELPHWMLGSTHDTRGPGFIWRGRQRACMSRRDARLARGGQGSQELLDV